MSDTDTARYEPTEADIRALLDASPDRLTASQRAERNRLLYGQTEFARAAPALRETLAEVIADARNAAAARAATERRRRETRAARRLASRMGHDLGLIEALTAAQLAALQGLGRLMLEARRDTGEASCDFALATIAQEAGVARSTLISVLAYGVGRGWVRRISYRPEADPETGQLTQPPSTYLPGPMMDRVMAWLDATPDEDATHQSTGDRKSGQTGYRDSESYKQKESSYLPENGGWPRRAGQARPGQPIARRQSPTPSKADGALSTGATLIAPEREHASAIGLVPTHICASATRKALERGISLLGEPIGGPDDASLLAAVHRVRERFAADWLVPDDLTRALKARGWWAALSLISTVIERAIRTRKPISNPGGRFGWICWKAPQQIGDPLAIPLAVIDKHDGASGDPAGYAIEVRPETAVPEAVVERPAAEERAGRELAPEFAQALDHAIPWAEALDRYERLRVLGRLQVPDRRSLIASGLYMRLIVAWRDARGSGRLSETEDSPTRPAEPAPRRDRNADILAAMAWFARLPAQDHARLMASRAGRDRTEHVLEAWRAAGAPSWPQES